MEEAGDDQVRYRLVAMCHLAAWEERPLSILRGSSITGVPQLKPSWEKRLKQREERTSVMAAQKAVTDTIIEEKRVRRCGRFRACCVALALTRLLPARAQAARAAREAKALRKKENEQKGLSYQVVRPCTAFVPPVHRLCPAGCLPAALLADGALGAADHRHEEDQEDEQEAAEVHLQDGHHGRQAQGVPQEDEDGHEVIDGLPGRG